jgi:hypothetical protein
MAGAGEGKRIFQAGHQACKVGKSSIPRSTSGFLQVLLRDWKACGYNSADQ